MALSPECEKANKGGKTGIMLGVIGHIIIMFWLLGVFSVIPMDEWLIWLLLSVGGLIAIIGLILLLKERKACKLM